MMPYGQQTQELIQAAFLLSQLVIAITMVLSSILETTLSSGVLLSSTPPSPCTAPCTSTLAMWAGSTTSIRRSVPPSVASGINHFNIWCERLAVCRAVILGQINFD